MNKDLITDAGALVKGIATWGKGLQSKMKEGQHLGLSSMLRLKEHGDIGPLNQLYLAMPKGTKTGSMAAWILEFTCLVANTGPDAKTKPFVFSKDKEATKGYRADMQKAALKPWQDCGKQEEEVAAIDALVKLEVFIAGLKKNAGKLLHAGIVDKLDQVLADARENGTEGDNPAEEAENKADALAGVSA